MCCPLRCVVVSVFSYYRMKRKKAVSYACVKSVLNKLYCVCRWFPLLGSI